MPNQHVYDRLVGVQRILDGVHQAGSSMSAATKGQEREAFIDAFLSQSLPPIYRFGTGDATDHAGNRSGQLDVVIEYPFAPSLPLGVGMARLYLAEGVAAVVEVKSDVASQWDEALRTAAQLSPLNRRLHQSVHVQTGICSGTDLARIPLFVVGYTGWKQPQTVRQHLQNSPDVSGVLVIDSGVFESSPRFGGLSATGPWGLWCLIACLYCSVSMLQSAMSDPTLYSR
jgi:hypothetical protein